MIYAQAFNTNQQPLTARLGIVSPRSGANLSTAATAPE
jgi:hypothetical protein